MADPAPERLIRVLTNLHHGGRAVSRPETPAGAARTAEAAPLDAVIQEAAPTSLEEISTPFDYLFGELKDEYPAAHLPVEPASTVVAGLKALGSAMVDAPPDAEPNSTIPPVYTYW